MSYTKPELLVLSVASSAVRTSGKDASGGGSQDGGKTTTAFEASTDDSAPGVSDGQTHTSSSGSAYEADE